jgi:putative ABC transport system permease protein
VKTLRTIWSRIRWLWQRREVKREIDEELRFHLEQRTAENVAAGMAPEAAASEARKRFGNVQSIREECREKRGVSFGEMTLQDVRFGLRMLRKNPGFAAVAVLTLALGIGGVTAVLSVMNGVFLRLLPYQDPGGMVLFSTSISGKDYVEWKAQSQSFSEMAAYRRHYSHDSANPLADTAQELKDAGGLAVEPSFFRALGIRPLLGRPLSDEEGCFEEKPVIILSHHIWRERFGADPQIVGRNVRLCGQSCRVVGVMPANYRLLPETFDPLREGGTINRRVDYWIPLPLHFRTSGPWDLAYNIVARLKGNVSLAKAQEESDVIVHRQWEQWLAKLNLAANAKYDHVVLQPLPRVLLGPVRTATFWLFGAAAMVLIIACANTVNLLLVRSMNRKGEIAVRSALGGSRLRIIRQMLTENVVLVFLGGALGILLAVWGVDVLVEMAPKKLPGLDQAGVDWRVLAAASGVALFTALIVGLIPAWSASRVNLTQALKDVGTQVTTGLREQRTLGLFVISEIALALMLVMGSGLLLHSYWRVMQVELGFERSHLLALSRNDSVGP